MLTFLLLIACPKPSPPTEVLEVIAPVEEPAVLPVEEPAVLPVEEEPDKEAIRKTVSKYSGQVQYCYEKQLRDDPDLEGKLELEFSIDQGNVVDAAVIENTTGNDALADCVAAKVLTWQFPEEVTGDVVYPFVLKPSN